MACLVEVVSIGLNLASSVSLTIRYLQGEVIARLVFHAAKTSRPKVEPVVNATTILASISREDALRVLEKIMQGQ